MSIDHYAHHVPVLALIARDCMCSGGPRARRGPTLARFSSRDQLVCATVFLLAYANLLDQVSLPPSQSL